MVFSFSSTPFRKIPTYITYTNIIFALIKLLCLQHVSITQRVCVHVCVPPRGVHIIGISLFSENVV